MAHWLHRVTRIDRQDSSTLVLVYANGLDAGLAIWRRLPGLVKPPSPIRFSISRHDAVCGIQPVFDMAGFAFKPAATEQ